MNKISLYRAESVLRVLAILLFLTVVSCTPSENAVQTAIAQTQSVLPTITFTPEPTATFVPTPTSTPDIRVIDVDPYELLLQKTDCPIDGRYYLPNYSWTSPHRNSEVIAGWTVEKGQEYLAETGRIDGWWVAYARGNPNLLLPQEYYDNVIIYATTTGAQLVINKYGDRFITESGYQEIADHPTIGDMTRVFVLEKTDESGVTRIMYRLEFSYRNVVHGMTVYGYDKEVSLDNLITVANIVLQRLKELPLSETVTFRP